MNQLSPCPECKRHVRVSETRCPFCASDIGAAMARVPARRKLPSGLSRAAVLALGGSAAALGAASVLDGCADSHDDDDNNQPIYGAPVQGDAGRLGPDAGGPSDGGPVTPPVSDASSGVPDSGGFAIYGAPVQPDGGLIAQPLYGAPVPPEAEPDASYGIPVYGAPVQERQR